MSRALRNLEVTGSIICSPLGLVNLRRVVNARARSGRRREPRMGRKFCSAWSTLSAPQQEIMSPERQRVNVVCRPTREPIRFSSVGSVAKLVESRVLGRQSAGILREARGE